MPSFFSAAGGAVIVDAADELEDDELEAVVVVAVSLTAVSVALPALPPPGAMVLFLCENDISTRSI